jgi:aldehyde dehydrogenase (NAD+)
MTPPDQLPKYDHFIDGAAQAPGSGEYLPTDDPYTGKTWGYIARGNRADAERAVRAARTAFDSGPWPALTASEPGRMLCRLADQIKDNAPRLEDSDRR